MAEKALTTSGFDAMDDAQLSKKLERTKAELFSLRLAQVADSLEDHGRMKTTHRDITHIYTIARERELGYHIAPSIKERAT